MRAFGVEHVRDLAVTPSRSEAAGCAREGLEDGDFLGAGGARGLF